ncbi:CynX/NimT family MFS transporter [Microbacterium sp. Marseille-Q6965]|uniref:MFS transporter n=1 Tax=Microbacterium sp. Marseille-Q6965 TaxID=2965072 RepID=UPI0021B7709E|nr:MFS transporter [Microbacterium sp. Marseille-Q6965]
MTSSPASLPRRAFPWLVVAGVLVAALSLRAPVLAVSPVLRDIEHQLGLDAAGASLIMTSAVLMFAIVTPAAALVIRRAGPELALLICLAGVIAGTLIRSVPSYGWMIAGMIVAGAAITIGNVVIPVIIRRDVPERNVATVTAAYTAMLNVGSLFATLATAPLAELAGWPLALLSWGLLSVVGIVLWVVHLQRDRAPGATWAERYSGETRAAGTAAESLALTGPVPVLAGRGRAVRHPVVWLLTGTFACQSAAYYAISTWLPAMAADLNGVDATTAGALASIFQGGAIVGAFVVPVLARYLPLMVPAAVVSACWILVSGGMLLAPQLLALWAAIGSIAHAGGFVVIFTVLMRVVRTDAEAATGSALVQGLAYVFGTLGAPIAGALHDATGGWSAPLAFSLALGVGFTVLLTGAVIGAQRR